MYVSGLLWETKFLPPEQEGTALTILLWLALPPVFPHVRSNRTSYLCVLLVLAKII